MFDLIWPSKKKLLALKRRGVYPYSQIIIRLVVFIVITLLVYRGSLNFLEIVNNLLNQQNNLISQKGLVVINYQQVLVETVILPSTIIILLVLAMAALKGKFSFNLSIVKFKFNRLWRWRWNGKFLINQIISFFCYLAVSLFLLLIIASFIIIIFDDFINILELQADPRKFFAFLANFVTIILAVAFLLIPVLYLSRWFLFRLEYRMTPEEMLNDSHFADDDLIARID